uniref:Uncharacterized protein n=1 Tax=Micrurus spixii TaxID=129469 RepID=A0A2D4N9F9_9SAUR
MGSEMRTAEASGATKREQGSPTHFLVPGYHVESRGEINVLCFTYETYGFMGNNFCRVNLAKKSFSFLTWAISINSLFNKKQYWTCQLREMKLPLELSIFITAK